MPKKYRVTLSDGRSLLVTTEGGPPSEQDIDEFLKASSAAPEAPGEAAAGMVPETAAPAVGSWWQASPEAAQAFQQSHGNAPAETDLINDLPMIGGMAAGVASGGAGFIPAVIAAALGGTAGAAFRQAGNALRGRMKDVPATIPEQLKEIGTEGAIQGAAEGVGRGIGKAATTVGKGLYRYAVRPNSALQREFPNALERGFEEGIAVGGGAEKAAQLGRESGREVQAAVRAAEAAGAPGIPIREILAEPGVKEALAIAARRSGAPGQVGAGRPSEVGSVLERIRRIAKSATTPVQTTTMQTVQRPSSILGPNGQPLTTSTQVPQTSTRLIPRPISLMEAQGQKEVNQDLANQAYRTAERGGVVNDLDTRIDEALAKGWKGAIEARTGGAAGPVAQGNARTQDFIGLERMMQQAEARRPGIGLLELFGGAGAGGLMRDPITGAGVALALRAARDPRVISRAGILFDRATPPAVTTNALRLLLMQQLAAPDSSATLGSNVP